MNVASRALGSRYELLSLLGSGAMGEVWRTADRATGQDVAAKVLRSEYSQNSDIVNRFLQERAIIRSLQHENIVRVHDLVVEGDLLAIVMDLVEGQDLRHALREAGTLDASSAVTVSVAVLRGLAAAHAQGVLHRDVKPDNVLLLSSWQGAPDTRDVRLTDFGIARLAQDSTVQATGLLGTPEYMPPELFTEGTSSAASDVYAAGVVLYELLAGRTPFAGEGTAYTIGNRAVTARPPSVPVAGPLWSQLLGMLEKDPRRRPTAAAAAAALDALLPSLDGQAALPLQADPRTWETVAGPAPALGVVRTHSEAAGLDVGATNLDVTFAPEQARAGAGPVEALTPESAVLDTAATNLGVAVPDYTAPSLTPKVDAPAPSRSNSRMRKILIGAVATVTAAGLAIGAWALTSSDQSADGHRSTAATKDAVTATSSDDAVPGTGLTVARAASYDAGAKLVSITFTFSADRVELGGPFLEVLPRAKGQPDCPLPTWTGATVTANDPLSSGITTPCGFAISVPSLRPGSPLKVTAAYPLTLPDGEPEQQLQSVLQGSADATQQALQGAGATSTAYPAQRLQGVDVEVPSLLSVAAAQVNVQILPVWGSGSADKLHPLFVSSVDQPTDLLRQVAGGVATIRFAEECDGAVIVRQRTVSIVRQSPACTLIASVGNLSNVSSNEFQIAGKGS